MKELDETNRQILRELGQDGRKTFSDISEKLEVTENTIRSRMNKLTSDGVLVTQGLVDPASIAGMSTVLMGIKVDKMNLASKAKEFLKLRGVVWVTVVTGRYDLLALISLSETDGFTLLDFFSEELPKIQDVQSAETFVVYQAHNLFVPYKF